MLDERFHVDIFGPARLVSETFLVPGLSDFVLLPSGFTEKPWEEWALPLTFSATGDTATPNALVAVV